MILNRHKHEDVHETDIIERRPPSITSAHDRARSIDRILVIQSDPEPPFKRAFRKCGKVCLIHPSRTIKIFTRTPKPAEA
jgi:hypothetical protein